MTTAICRLLLLLLALGLPRLAAAQLFSYDQERPQTVQSLSAGFTFIDFVYTGDSDPSPRFDFDDPLYGLVYTRPNLQVALAYGQESNPADTAAGNLRMLDVALSTWGTIDLTEQLGAGKTRIGIPILLHSQYRRAARSDVPGAVTEAFEISALGLGTGLVATRPLGSNVLLEARVTPIIALALRTFGETAGSTRLVDADIHLHVGSITRRLGLSFGYGFRWQRWSIGASDLFTEVTDDFFDYRSQQHTFSVGLNW